MAEIEELNIAIPVILGQNLTFRANGKKRASGLVLKESWLRDPPPANAVLFTPYCPPPEKSCSD